MTFLMLMHLLNFHSFVTSGRTLYEKLPFTVCHWHIMKKILSNWSFITFLLWNFWYRAYVFKLHIMACKAWGYIYFVTKFCSSRCSEWALCTYYHVAYITEIVWKGVVCKGVLFLYHFTVLLKEIFSKSFWRFRNKPKWNEFICY